MNLIEAIEERRTRLTELSGQYQQLEAEILQLEKAKELVETVLAGPSMKPPPRAKKGKAVRANAKPAAVPGLCLACKKPIPPRKKGTPGRQKQYHPECKAAKSAKAPKTKSEEDPVRHVPMKPITVVAAPVITAKPEGLVLSVEERARLLSSARSSTRPAPRAKPGEDQVAYLTRVKAEARAAAAIPEAAPVVAVSPPAKVIGTCECVDFDSGRRCTLPFHGNKPPHSASGRTFHTALLPHEIPKPRELDERALEAP